MSTQPTFLQVGPDEYACVQHISFIVLKDTGRLKIFQTDEEEPFTVSREYQESVLAWVRSRLEPAPSPARLERREE